MRKFRTESNSIQKIFSGRRALALFIAFLMVLTSFNTNWLVTKTEADTYEDANYDESSGTAVKSDSEYTGSFSDQQGRISSYVAGIFVGTESSYESPTSVSFRYSIPQGQTAKISIDIYQGCTSSNPLSGTKVEGVYKASVKNTSDTNTQIVSQSAKIYNPNISVAQGEYYSVVINFSDATAYIYGGSGAGGKSGTYYIGGSSLGVQVMLVAAGPVSNDAANVSITDLTADKSVVAVGDTVQLTPTLSSERKRNITYSSDSNVFTVDGEGVAYANSEGTSVITATIAGGNKKTISLYSSKAAIQKNGTTATSGEYDGNNHTSSLAINVTGGKTATINNISSGDTSFDISRSGDWTNVGKHSVTLTGKGDFAGYIETLNYSITAKKLTSDNVVSSSPVIGIDTSENTVKTLTGLTCDGQDLKLGKDFTASLTKLSDTRDESYAVHYKIDIAGKGNYTGEYTLEDDYVYAGDENGKIDISTLVKSFHINSPAVVYNADDQKPKASDLEFTDKNGNTLTLDTSRIEVIASVSGDSSEQEEVLECKNVGTYEISVKAKDDTVYTGTVGKKVNFSIEKVSLADKKNAYELTNAELRIGTTKKETIVNRASETDALTPYIVAKFGENTKETLKEDTDYTVERPSTFKAGSNAKFKINGIGNYEGQIELSIKVVPDFTKDLDIYIGGSEAEVSTSSKWDYETDYDITYTGSVLTPSSVNVYVGGKKLTKDTDYTLDYGKNEDHTAPGDCTLKITGIGDYNGSGAAIIKWAISRAKLDSSVKLKQLSTKTFNGQSQTWTAGNNSNNKKDFYLYTVSNNEEIVINPDNYTFTVKGEDSDETDTININAGTTTLVITGKDPYYEGTIEREVEISPLDINSQDSENPDKTDDIYVKVSDISLTYTGSAIKPIAPVLGGTDNDYSVSLIDENTSFTGSLYAERDFNVKEDSYTNNKDISSSGNTASFEIEGTGNYTGSRTVNFNIVSNKDFKNFKVTVDGEKVSDNSPVIWSRGRTYTGNVISPAVTVYDTYSKKNLTEGTDYDVRYNSNVNANESVSITSDDKIDGPYIEIVGKGNYVGDDSYKQIGFPIWRRNIGDTARMVSSGSITIKNNENINFVVPDYTVEDYQIDTTGGNVTTVLEENKDYTIDYGLDGKTKAGGECNITVSGIGNYKGTLTQKYTIGDSIPELVTKKTLKVSIDGVYYPETNPVQIPYTGKKPTVKLVNSNDTEIAENEYTYSFDKDEFDAETTVNVTIEASDTSVNYYGEISVPFTIMPLEVKYDNNTTSTPNKDIKGNTLTTEQIDLLNNIYFVDSHAENASEVTSQGVALSYYYFGGKMEMDMSLKGIEGAEYTFTSGGNYVDINGEKPKIDTSRLKGTNSSSGNVYMRATIEQKNTNNTTNVRIENFPIKYKIRALDLVADSEFAAVDNDGYSLSNFEDEVVSVGSAAKASKTISYDGEQHKPGDTLTLKVKDGAGVEHTLDGSTHVNGSTSSDFTKVGDHTYTLTSVTGVITFNGMTYADNAKPNKVYTLKIESKNVDANGSNIEIETIAYQTYTGSALTPDVVVKDKSISDTSKQTLSKDTDYTIKYSDNQGNGDSAKGTANPTELATGTTSVIGTATVEFKGNYSGTKTKDFKILYELGTADATLKVGTESKDITSGSTVSIDELSASDTALTIQTKSTGSPAAELGTVAYTSATSSNNYFNYSIKDRLGNTQSSLSALNVGQYYIEITGEGETTAKNNIRISFTVEHGTIKHIVDTSKEGTDITNGYYKETYTGDAIAPITSGGWNNNGTTISTFEIQNENNIKLTLNKDYKVTYSSNVNVGDVTVTVSGYGNYVGCEDLTMTFKIDQAELTDSCIEGITDRYYTGSVIEQEPTVKFAGRTLVKGTDYNVTYDGGSGHDSKAAGKDTGYVKVTGEGNFKGSGEKTYAIQYNLGSATIAEITYNNKNLSTETLTIDDMTEEGLPTVQVKINDEVLSSTNDYVVSVRKFGSSEGMTTLKGSGVGTYVVLISPNTTTNTSLNSKETTFKVAAALIDNATVTRIKTEETLYYAGGNPVRPAVKVTKDSQELKEGTDYTLEYEDNINAGSAKVYAVGMGNYSGKTTNPCSFAITAKPFQDDSTEYINITGITDKEYTGDNITQDITVSDKDSGAPLTVDKDYSVSYDDNRVVNDNASITLTAKSSNYSGSITKTFKITKRAFSLDKNVTLKNTSSYFDNTDQTDNIKKDLKVYFDGSSQELASTEYNVSVNGGNPAKDAGEYEIIITPTDSNNYNGNITTVYTINPRPLDTEGFKDEYEKTLSPKSKFEFTKDQENLPKPTPVIKNKNSEIGKLTCNYEDENKTDYTFSYENNDKAGKKGVSETYPKVIVEGKNNYTGTIELDFVIGTDITSYSVERKTGENKSAPYNWGEAVEMPEVVVKNGTVPIADTAYTVAWDDDKAVGKKTATATGVQEEGFYGKATGTEIFEITKVQADPGKLDIALPDAQTDSYGVTGLPAYYYCGEDIHPVPTVTYTNTNGKKITLVQGEDFDVSYNDKCKDASTYQIDNDTNKPTTVNSDDQARVTITLKGNYADTTKDKTFVIMPLNISQKDTGARLLYDFANSDGYSADLNGFPYTGNAITPKYKFTVTNDLLGTVTPEKGKDYTEKYTDNIKVGNEGKVTLTGEGNFTGTLTPNVGDETFRILGNLSDEKCKIEIDTIKAGTEFVDIEASNIHATFDGEAMTKGVDFRIDSIIPDNENWTNTATAKIVPAADAYYYGSRNVAFGLSDNGAAPIVAKTKIITEVGTLSSTSRNIANGTKEDDLSGYLPQTVDLTWSDGSATGVVSGAIAWTDITGKTYDRYSPVAQTRIYKSSKITVPDGYKDADGVAAAKNESFEYTLYVLAGSGDGTVKMITAVGNTTPSSTTVENGTTATNIISKLPATVPLTYVVTPSTAATASGGTVNGTITWGSVPSKYDAGSKKSQSFTMSGTISVSSDYEWGLKDSDKTITHEVTVSADPSTEFDITLSSTSFIFNNATQSPTVSATSKAGKALTKDTDYTLEYNSVGTGVSVSGVKTQGTASSLATTTPTSMNVGTYSIKAVGKTGTEYEGCSVTKQYTITAKDISSTGGSDGINHSINSTITYTGSAVTPGDQITFNGTPLTAGTDYDITYTRNIYPGKAQVKVTGKGNYSGTYISYVDIIIPISGLKAKTIDNDTVRLTWNKTTKADGYQITYRQSSKNKVIKAASNSIDINGLSAGSTTTFAVCAYATFTDDAGTSWYYGSAKTVSGTTKVKAPTLKVKSPKKKRAKLTWTKTSNMSGVVIYRSTKKSSGFKKIKTVSTTSGKTYTNTKLKSGKTYYYYALPYKNVKTSNGTVKVYGTKSKTKKIKVK